MPNYRYTNMQYTNMCICYSESDFNLREYVLVSEQYLVLCSVYVTSTISDPQRQTVAHLLYLWKLKKVFWTFFLFEGFLPNNYKKIMFYFNGRHG